MRRSPRRSATASMYRPPMAFEFYKNINDADMAALIAYLRSLKPLASAAKS